MKDVSAFIFVYGCLTTTGYAGTIIFSANQVTSNCSLFPVYCPHGVQAGVPRRIFSAPAVNFAIIKKTPGRLR